MILDVNDTDFLDNLTKSTEGAKREVIKLIAINKYLMKLIESTLVFTPPSTKYQLNFAEKIDEQLVAGQIESSFWKDKLVKQRSDS